MADTVYQQFREAAKEAPDNVFLCYPPTPNRDFLPRGAEFTYAEALAAADALAIAYRRAGYGEGHRVGLVLGNRPEHFLHLMALNSIGVSCVLINPDYVDDEMAFAFEFAECTLVLAHPGNLQSLRNVAAALKVPVPVTDVASGLPDLPAPGRPPGFEPTTDIAREALIIYTSGTTGRPKGCIISNGSCLAGGEKYGKSGGLSTYRIGQDRVYMVLPAFHMNMSVVTINAMTLTRNCLVVQDRFRLSTWWSDIVQSGATTLHYLGIVPPLLLKSDPVPEEKQHKIRFGFGAGVDPSVREAFEARFGFPLIETWGMTETSRAIMNNIPPRDMGERAFGRPTSPLEVLVVDENDKPVPVGEAGELLVRAAGPDPRSGFFSGYLKQPEETEKAWRNGWFHTGDIVWQSQDGMLHFVERRKNIIRRSGENIAAAQVEDVLIADPRVNSVAVLAVKDELHDEDVMACIRLTPGIEAGRATAEAIFEAARGKLQLAKLPAWIAFVDSIPVTNTQKVRKGLIFAENTDPRNDPRSFDLRDMKRRKPATAAAEIRD